MEMKKNLSFSSEPMEVDESSSVKIMNIDSESVLGSSKEVHQENLEILAKMRKEEILAERAKLLQSVGKCFCFQFPG